MNRVALAGLSVHPLCLGGNVFGWTSDEETSFAVLDAYVEAGGNFIDTADSYSVWIPGLSGGESETIIGKWLAARKNRDQLVIATKVGRLPQYQGLSEKSIAGGVDASLARLGIDHIDLYYTHVEDPTVPLAETLGSLDRLVGSGKVRYLGASNHTASRFHESLTAARADGLAEYVALQEEYNLVERRGYEAAHERICASEGIAFLPYYSLANGFLSGKYRPGTAADSMRAGKAAKYLKNGGAAVLAALDEVAANHHTTVAAVSLAWLASRPTVVTPLASARTPEQLIDLLDFSRLELAPDELDLLDRVSIAANDR